MILLKSLLKETVLPTLILGAITTTGDVIARYAYSDIDRHPPEWERFTTWRYVPDFETIFWWVPPNDTDKRAAAEYLNKLGFAVSRQSVRASRN